MYYLDALSPHLNLRDIYLYGTAALMLAAKSCEVDSKIPFISKLKKYAAMTTHPEMNYY